MEHDQCGQSTVSGAQASRATGQMPILRWRQTGSQIEGPPDIYDNSTAAEMKLGQIHLSTMTKPDAVAVTERRSL